MTFEMKANYNWCTNTQYVKDVLFKLIFFVCYAIP